MNAPETLGLEREAEDELLALLARGIREAAALRPAPILRVVGEGERVSEDLRDRGLPASHQRVSRHDWQHGLACCHACRRAVDIHADTAHLHDMHGPPDDDVVVFQCPRCGETSHFHVEVAP